MKFQGHSTVLSLTAITLLASSLFGCATHSSHEGWVNDADSRWKSLRSTALLEMAKDRFEAGALDQAEKTVTEAAAIDSTNPQLHLLAGRIALERGQLERAYRLFQLSADLNANEPDTFYYQGVILQRWKQYDAALEAYQSAYDLDKDNPARLLAIGETLVELDRPQDAIELLEEKKYYFDQNAGLRALLGHLYRMQGEPRLAVEAFRQATTLDAENMRLHEELAFSQVEAGNFADAATTLRMLLALPEYENRSDLKRSLAQAEAETGRLQSAREIYIELTRDDPSHTADWLRLGEVSWKLDDTGGALIAANRAISLSPQREEGYLLAGMVWQKRGRVQDALEMFDRAAELAPQDATPLILRGLSLQKTDRLAAAAEAYEEALRRDPEDRRAERLLTQVTSP
ncbi:MAG: tetratricopeptide repeat protein [Planctomycetota bacterium]